MSFQDTDLFMVNRGGTNYKISYADLINKTGVQSTDLLMLQRNAVLYNIAYSALGTSGQPVQSTDFFLVERDGELYAREATGMAVTSPCQILYISPGSATDSNKCLVFEYFGCRPLNGVPAQIRSASPGGDVIYLGAGDGTITLPSSACGPTMQIYGAFDTFQFKNSTGLTGHTTINSQASDWNTIMPTPDSSFGTQLYRNCPLLTIIDINVPVRSMFQFLKDSISFNMSGTDLLTTTGVNDFTQAFEGATLFDQPLATWDMSSARLMSNMFDGATAFNQNLNAWGPAFTIAFYMDSMFTDATTYNQPMDQWDVSSLRSGGLNAMFNGATNFSQDLSGWCVTNFPSEPGNFSSGSALTNAQLPVWGTCP